ncbi:MAG: 4-hydroxy-tetrahydrodipicolinate reductase [Deltaproteobacteria bacterium]|nr:4-hydroxy-tetrahydrodipicolinate reductase [Deltaproteobacteria bacterium]
MPTTTLPLILAGAAGKMGREIATLVRADAALELVAALEATGSAALGKPLVDVEHRAGPPVVTALADWALEAMPAGAVVIDFSSPKGLGALAEKFLAVRPLPLVTGTTGLGPDEERLLAELAERSAVLHSPNMSLGVAATRAAAALLARALGPGFDVEIAEIHHTAKKDAPSGTALALARSVLEARGEVSAPVFDRTTRGRPRERGGVGVVALRGGAVVGEHTVYFLGEDERIDLTHRAVSRRVFARGALRAASWLAGRAPGRYSMDDVLRG